MKLGKRSAGLLFALIAVAGVICLGALTGCQEGGQSGVAATVNGEEIPESKVTDQIQNMRKRNNLDTKDSFGKYLVDSDSDAAKLREDYIDSLVDDELIRQAAEFNKITVSEDEINASIDGMKENFTDDEWKEALDDLALTEDQYRENIEKAILRIKVARAFILKAEPEDSDYESLVSVYATRFDGSKKTAHILFALDDEKTAKKVLKDIKNDKISFEDAAKKYSIDHSASSKGDAGWDAWATMTPEYYDAIADMKKGDITDELVKDIYGYHIIKVTGTYTAPEEAKAKKDLPKAFLETLEQSAKTSKGSSDFSTWLTDIHDNADIVINDMPADVPYNFDLTKYKEAKEKEEAEANANNAEATDGTVEGEGTEVTVGDDGQATVEIGDESGDAAAEGDATVDDGSAAEGADASSDAGSTDAAADSSDASSDDSGDQDGKSQEG